MHLNNFDCSSRVEARVANVGHDQAPSQPLDGATGYFTGPDLLPFLSK